MLMFHIAICRLARARCAIRHSRVRCSAARNRNMPPPREPQRSPKSPRNYLPYQVSKFKGTKNMHCHLVRVIVCHAFFFKVKI